MYYIINSIYFQIIYSNDFNTLSKKEKYYLKKMPNHANCKGIIISYSRDRKQVISIVNFSSEFFPYENDSSVHVFMINKKNEYIGTLCLLTSFLIIFKIEKVKNIIARYKIKQILSLLMCFDIGFEISEYALHPTKIIILKRPVRNINVTYINSIEKLNFKQISNLFIFKNKINLISEPIKNPYITKHHIKILQGWFNLKNNIIPNLLFDFEKLIKLQKNFKCKKYIENNSYLFSIENTQSSICLIIFSSNIFSRQILIDFNNFLKNKKYNFIYLEKDFKALEAILFFIGYIKVGEFKKSKTVKFELSNK